MYFNGYVLLVLLAQAAVLAVCWKARALNMQALAQGAPPEFQDVYDQAEYARANAYARARAGYENVREACGFAAVCLVAVSGALGLADQWARGLAFGDFGAGLCYLGALAAAQSVFELPFDAYATFRLEARFGFNTTTPGVFWADRLKGLALTAVLGGALASAVLLAFAWFGPLAWLAAWVLVGLFMAGLMYAAPVWLLPLFNTFKPLDQGPLRQSIEAYAAREGFRLDGVFVMDGSRRSTKANAFFTGFGGTKRISLFDTLLATLTDQQLLAVLAHEMGHAKLHHQLKGFALALAKLGALLYLLQLFLGAGAMQQGLGVATPSAYAGLVVFGLVYQPLALALGVVANAFSRRWEFQADAYAAAGPTGPAPLAQALKALSVSSLSNLTPHPLWVWLHASHPPVLERIRALGAPHT